MGTLNPIHTLTPAVTTANSIISCYSKTKYFDILIPAIMVVLECCPLNQCNVSAVFTRTVEIYLCSKVIMFPY